MKTLLKQRIILRKQSFELFPRWLESISAISWSVSEKISECPVGRFVGCVSITLLARKLVRFLLKTCWCVGYFVKWTVMLLLQVSMLFPRKVRITGRGVCKKGFAVRQIQVEFPAVMYDQNQCLLASELTPAPNYCITTAEGNRHPAKTG